MIVSVEGDRVALLEVMRARNRIAGLIGRIREEVTLSGCEPIYTSKSLHLMCWPLSRGFERSLQGSPWLTARLRSKWS